VGANQAKLKALMSALSVLRGAVRCRGAL
jgi:hypothetical protein